MATQSVSPLTASEQNVLDALRKDRDESGPGLDRWEVEKLDNTVYPDRTIQRLREHGFVVGFKDGGYQLGHSEPASTRASDDGRPAPFPVGRSSGVPVEAEQLPIPNQPRKARQHYEDAA